MEISPPVKPPRGIKPGKESSGLLMSVIRTLSASETNEQRDTEKLKVEEEFRRSDRKLDELVSKHDQELTKTMQLFGTLSVRVNESKENIRQVKENLELCKVLLHCKRDELKKLWLEGLEYKYMLQLLEEIEEMTEIPNKFMVFLGKKHYLQATQLLVNATSLNKSNLEGVEAIRELTTEIEQKKQELYGKLLEELRLHLYVKPCEEVTQLRRQGSGAFQRSAERISNRKNRNINNLDSSQIEDLENDNGDGDSTHVFAILTRCLGLLGRSPTAVDTLRRNCLNELQEIAVFTVQQLKHLQRSSTSPLLDFINTLCDEFREIVKMFAIFQQQLHKQNPAVDTFDSTEVWSRVLEILKQILIDHLDVKSTEQIENIAETNFATEFHDSNDFNSYFNKKKSSKKKLNLFKFDESSTAITESEAKNNDKDKSWLVCAPDSNYITSLFIPLSRFCDEVEQATNIKPCTLNVFLNDFITKDFLNRRRADLQLAVEVSTRGSDAWNVVDGTKQILKNVILIESKISSNIELLKSLPLHAERVLRDTVGIISEYLSICENAYKNSVHPTALSAVWLRDDDIRRFLQSLPNWLELKASTLDEEGPEAVRQRNEREAEILASNLGAAGVGYQELLSDSSALRTLALLHESLEWLSERIHSFGKELRLESVAVSAASLQQLITVGDDMQDLSNHCLLVLHLEVRVQCFHYLLLTDEKNLNTKDVIDVEERILSLGRALNKADDSINGALRPRKCRYVFEGLGHLVANVLINAAGRMNHVDPAAIQRQCRNILSLQQSLSAVTLSRDPALDHARRYFELLLCSSPDDLLAAIMEKGTEFTQLEYINALQLLVRTQTDKQNSLDTYLQRLNDIFNNVNGVTV